MTKLSDGQRVILEMNKQQALKHAELYQAMIDGDVLEVQYDNEGSWKDRTVGIHPLVYGNNYRVKRTPLVIPWEMINSKWKYAAKDEDGEVWLYDDKPRIGIRRWFAPPLL